MTEFLFLIIIPIAAAMLTWWGTGRVRDYALRTSLLDMPTNRSSHTAPTPRGGGLAVLLVVLATVAFQAAMGLLNIRYAIAVLGGGGLVAAIGWIDDHGHVAPKTRLIAQLLAAAWVVFWVSSPEAVVIGEWLLPLGPLAPAVMIVGLIWLTNLFNFMDGIDGIASTEGAIVSAVGGGLLVAASQPGLAAVAFSIAGACVGFLLWNRPPARIFMGDVGSGFLGIGLGTLAVAAAVEGAVQLQIWALLLGVFIVDATVTLFRRIGREQLSQAHRKHAYQRAVQAGLTHGQVTTGVLVLNLALSVCAVVAWAMPRLAPAALATALVILAAVYVAVERMQPMWNDAAPEDELA